MSFSPYTGGVCSEFKPVPIYHQNSKGPGGEQAPLDPATQAVLDALRLQQAALEQQILLMQAGQTTQLPTTTSTGPIPDMSVASSTNELARMVEEEELIENDQSENVIRNIKKEFDSRMKRRLTDNSLSSNAPSTSSSNTSVAMSSPSTSAEFNVKMEPFEFQEGSLLIAEEDDPSSGKKAKIEISMEEAQSPIPQDDESYEAPNDVPSPPGLAKIESGAEFKNFNDFETAFAHWKSVGKHPMRIASSLTLKDLVGNQNTVYCYKSIVYQCAHYGIPRHRGFGARPNQNYLPCGCRSMLRLAYDYQKQTLRICKMVKEHRGHPLEDTLNEFRPRLDRAVERPLFCYSRTVNPNIHEANFSGKGSRPSVGAPMAQGSEVQAGPSVVNDGSSMEQIISVFLQQQKATHDLLSNCQRNNPGSLDISKLFGMNIPDLSKIAAQTTEHIPQNIVKLEVDEDM